MTPVPSCRYCGLPFHPGMGCAAAKDIHIGCAGKHPFDSYTDASRAAQRQGTSRVYRCSACHKWHLTYKGKKRGHQ